MMALSCACNDVLRILTPPTRDAEENPRSDDLHHRAKMGNFVFTSKPGQKTDDGFTHDDPIRHEYKSAPLTDVCYF